MSFFRMRLKRLRRLLSVPLSFFRMRFSDFVDY